MQQIGFLLQNLLFTQHVSGTITFDYFHFAILNIQVIVFLIFILLSHMCI